MTSITARLARHAAALCVASACVFAAMTVLEFLYFRSLSGGLSSLDLRIIGFTPDEGLEWLNALGRRGAENILVWHYLTFDLLFPALLSATLVSLILVAGNRLPRFAALSKRVQSILALGFVLPYTVADYAQNLAVARVLANPLAANPDTLSLASGLVVAKFALGAIPLMVIAALFLAGEAKKA
jgi:hypothetical protein